MRNPGGHIIIDAPDKESRRVVVNGTVIDSETEADCFTCGHCNFVVAVKPLCDAADMGGLCKQCMTLICPKCYGLGSCTPIEKAVEQWEAQARFRRQMQEWG